MFWSDDNYTDQLQEKITQVEKVFHRFIDFQYKIALVPCVLDVYGPEADKKWEQRKKNSSE
jgi:hypothetical protein